MTQNTQCPKCSSHRLEELSYSDTVDFRGLELDVEHLMESHCHECAHFWTTSIQEERNQAIILREYRIVCDRIRVTKSMLSGEEIAAIRHQLNLELGDASKLFGVMLGEFRQYETGERLQSLPMDRLLRLAGMVGMPTLEFLKNISNND